MYRQQASFTDLGGNIFIPKSIIRLPDGATIPFDPANTDYQTFKSQINSDEARLEDADGNLMTAEEAKAFVATLL